MIVLIHGVPETADLWDDVRERLDHPSVALRLPGFGSDRPDGFTATKDAYVDWIADEIKRIDEPVDLVGHDWGGGFSVRIGMKYPDLVRSWVTDVGGVVHPDYVWHDFAQIWQTEGAGEEFWAGSLATPADVGAATYQGFGLDERAAAKLWGMADATMASCILPLYRSATPNPYADWADSFAKSEKPCLVINPTGDPFTSANRSPEVAEVFGAQLATIESGHFWPMEKPDEGAKILNDFVASL
jgi:pimeloyl-ACP methyl ester carboxylesterase